MAVVIARGARRMALAVMHTVAGVMVLRAVTGPWVTAAFTGAVVVASLVVCWAKVEARVFDRRPAVSVVSRPTDDHVAFARALAAVAAAYLAECESEARR